MKAAEHNGSFEVIDAVVQVKLQDASSTDLQLLAAKGKNQYLD